MTIERGSPSPAAGFSWRRLVPVIVIGALSLAVWILFVATGWNRELSLEALARHYDALRHLIAAHALATVIGYIALYIGAVALSLPVGAYLTVIGGILLGTLAGGMAAVAGASAGAVCFFLVARSAVGENLARRAGPAAERLASGFRADAFNYLLFLRLVPIFPFWLVNLVAALSGMRLAPFAAATVIGITPATFAFAFVGSGLESAINAEESLYRACLAAGRSGCRLALHADVALTPQLIAALVLLGVLALVPVAVKRLRGAHA